MELKKEFITTTETANFLGVQGATMRRGYCVNGHYMGMVPVKLPNNRLLWPRKAVKRILNANEE